MHLTRKLLARIAAGALVVTFIIRLVTVFSIQGIYSCSTADCSALSQADTKISTGVTLQYISSAVFVISLIMLLYLWVAKKKQF